MLIKEETVKAMKEKKWIRERKSVLLKDLIQQMLSTRLFFNDLYEQYKKSGHVAFKDLELWIGTENNKGSLWNLKDSSHVLFRENMSKQLFYENIFDWTLGSIFHEGMKLKEDVYIVEVYNKWGTVFTESKKIPDDVNLADLRGEYTMIIKRAQESIAQEMDSLRYLFIRAMDQLQKIIIQNKNDGLLIRFLVEAEDQFDHVYGEGSLKSFFESIYDRGLIDAYLTAGKNYREGGWYHEALRLLRRALSLSPQDKGIKKEYELIQKKLESEE
jgi:hypothetical protein